MTLEQPDLVERLVRLAESTCAMRSRLDARLGIVLSPHSRRSSPAKGVAIDRAAFAGLPEELQRYALRYTHRCALRPYPPSRVAQSELLSQLARDRAVGCDCGDGWRWSAQGAELELAPTRPKTPPFTYTLSVPGAVELDELSLRIRVRPEKVSPWMFRASRDRAAMALPLSPGDRVTIRNRRSGDRIQPFGWERHCRVKELLINRRVPQERRSRLPFLCYEGTIAWIPGVTVNERFRLSSQETAWVAEIEAIEPTR